MKRVTIGIDEDIWADLLMIKAEKRLRSFDEVLKHLLSNQKPEFSNSLPYIKLKLDSQSRGKK